MMTLRLLAILLLFVRSKSLATLAFRAKNSSPKYITSKKEGASFLGLARSFRRHDVELSLQRSRHILCISAANNNAPVGFETEMEELVKLCPEFTVFKAKSSTDKEGSSSDAIPSTSDSISSLVQSLEEKCPADLVCMYDTERIDLLDGTWDTLATTLPMARILPFSRLIMAKAGSHLDNINITVTHLLQFVDMRTGAYDNIIEFSLPCDTGAALVTRGRATVPEADGTGNPNRLSVEFYLNQVLPASPTRQYSLDSTGPEEGMSEKLQQLRAALSLSEDFALEFPMSLLGYSDVIFLDSRGQFRVMRGNGGGLYVLKKL